MNIKIGSVVAATIAACALSAPAMATTWDFSQYGAVVPLGSPFTTFNADDSTALGAAGVTGWPGAPLVAQLAYKSDGSGETGLGLASDPDHEIGPGQAVVLKLQSAGAYTFVLDSLQSPADGSNPAEGGTISECTTALVCTALASLTGPPVEQSVTVTLANASDYLVVSDNLPAGGGANIVLESLTVPEPATLSLLGLGLAAVGFMRRRKSA